MPAEGRLPESRTERVPGVLHMPGGNVRVMRPTFERIRACRQGAAKARGPASLGRRHLGVPAVEGHGPRTGSVGGFPELTDAAISVRGPCDAVPGL